MGAAVQRGRGEDVKKALASLDMCSSTYQGTLIDGHRSHEHVDGSVQVPNGPQDDGCKPEQHSQRTHAHKA